MRTCRYVIDIDSAGCYDRESNRCGRPATHVSAGRVDLCAEHASKHVGAALILTADTITDEQIRELRTVLCVELDQLAGNEWADKRVEIMWTERGLGIRSSRAGGKAKARARCAEILNARSTP